MRTWGWSSPASSSSIWPSGATGLPGCSRSSRTFRPRVAHELRLLASDAILTFLTANVVLSGILDWGRGAPLLLPLPQPFDRWHLTSSALLVVYMAVHVSRRWKRLRRSTIR